MFLSKSMKLMIWAEMTRYLSETMPVMPLPKGTSEWKQVGSRTYLWFFISRCDIVKYALSTSVDLENDSVWFSERSGNGGSGQTMFWFTLCHQIYIVLQLSRFRHSAISRTSGNGQARLDSLSAFLSYTSEQLPCILLASFWKHGEIVFLYIIMCINWQEGVS